MNLIGFARFLAQVWTAAKGYRTHLASAAAILSALAGLAGVLPSATSQGLAVAFGGLAAIALRLSQSDHALTLAEALQALQDAKAALDAIGKATGTLDTSKLTAEPQPPPEPPATIPFPGVRSLGLILAAGIVVAGASGSAAWAAPPKAIIEGSDPSISGEIIVLDASASEGEPTSYSWEITPEIRGRRNLLPFDGGRKVITHTFPGTYLVELIVSNADGHSRAVRQMTIPGSPPPDVKPQPTPPQPVPPGPPAPTPPAPPPAPTPQPAPEPALTGIALQVYTAAQAVSSPNRAAEATCLANGCQALSSALAAGKYSGVALVVAQGVVTEMGQVMERCATPAWSDAREHFATMIDRKWKAGELNSVEDWRSLVNQIEQGLRRVK